MSSSSNTDRRDAYKLDGDLRDAYVELLSAQCAVERLKMRYSPDELATKGSKFMVSRAISAASLICEYFSSVQRSSQPQAGPCPSRQKDLFHDDSL